MSITVIYSLPTRRALATPFKATDEDTKDSAEEVAQALAQKGATVELVPVREDGVNRLSTINGDCIFNLIEWDGLDTPLYLEALGLLEAKGTPFTGPGLATMTRLTDKVKMKESLDVAGIPTPRWQLFSDGSEPVRKDFVYPVIMKLAWEHCSIGLSRGAIIERRENVAAKVAAHSRAFGQPVYIEEFVEGREFQVTVLEEGGGPQVLPPAEIVFAKGGKDGFLTFESRWDEAHPDYGLSHVIRARPSPHLSKRLEEMSLAAHTSLGFRDVSRMDIRLRGEEPLLLEAIPNPGLEDDDAYGMTVSYKAAGMTFADFVWKIVASAIRRFRSAR